MGKLKKSVTNIRIIALVLFLIFAVITIHPDPYNKGVAIQSISFNSSAAEAGMHSPLGIDKPMSREVIFEVDGRAVDNLDEYAAATSNLQPGQKIIMRTRSSFTFANGERTYSIAKQIVRYELTVKPIIEYTVLNETESVFVPRTVTVNETVNGTVMEVNKTINETVVRNKVQENIVGAQDLGIKVVNAPTNNIKKGLDLQGGTRVLLQPAQEVSDDDLTLIIDNLEERLNVFGLSDVVIRKVSDLSQNKFILVEVAGANEDEVKDLISSQGKFEAKIGNETVFRGGDDIRFVCRSADCSFAVDPRRPCSRDSSGQWFCNFQFSITLSPESAQSQADMTRNLEIVTENGEQYLSESLDLYLDDDLVDTLRIGASLRGTPTTDIAISGSGTGESQQAARQDSADNMKRLQTILKTGSLPVKMNIVKIDTVSPVLGEEFVKNVLFVGALALLAVSAIIVIRYRDLKIALPLLATMFSEVVILLGFASLIGWNMDLAAIAGILIAVGTGVDDQIVIIDEIKGESTSRMLDWKARIKRAFFIITAAWSTTMVAMVSLLWAGAGIVKGFAITTMVGVTIGVFVTRPAFSAIMELILKE